MGALMRCSALVQCTACATVPSDTWKTSLGCTWGPLSTSHGHIKGTQIPQQRSYAGVGGTCSLSILNSWPEPTSEPMSKVDTKKAPASGSLHSPFPSSRTFPQDSDTTYSLTDSKIWLNLTSSESSSLDSIFTNSQSSSISHPALFFFLLLFF